MTEAETHYELSPNLNDLEHTMVFMDIDQTLANGVVKAHFEYYASKFPKYVEHLAMIGKTVDDVRNSFDTESYTHIKHVPGFDAFWDKGDQEFEAARLDLRTDEELHKYNLEKISGATQAVWKLFAITGGLEYQTVRPNKFVKLDGEQTDVMRVATEGWLGGENKDGADPMVFFPMHTRKPDGNASVIMSGSPAEKLQNILDHQTDLKLKVLIDDSLEKLLQAAINIHQNADNQTLQELRKTVLVGFGFDQERLESLKQKYNIPDDFPVTLIALESWSEDNFYNMVGRLVHEQNSRSND